MGCALLDLPRSVLPHELIDIAAGQRACGLVFGGGGEEHVTRARPGRIAVDIDHYRGHEMKVRLVDEAGFRLAQVLLEHRLDGGRPRRATEASGPHAVAC